MKYITVVQTNVDVGLFVDEALSDKASSLWVSYGPLFKAFEYTETIRLIGPAEIIDKEKMEDSLRNSSEFKVLAESTFPRLLRWLQVNFTNIQRAALIKLLPDQKVLRHVDRGEWFKKTRRYHLCLQGAYRYEVGDEHIVVTPGTLFTFDNSVEHGAFNLRNEDRITLMFDIKQ